MKANANLKHYLDRLGLPHGCLPIVESVYKRMDARIWVIENSSAMNTKDSHLIKASENFECIAKKDGVSRWNELVQCVDFHTKMAARCWIPTKFWLVNEPKGNVSRRFSLCWGQEDEVKGELNQATQILTGLTLDVRANPLAHEIRKIEKYLSKEASNLKDKDEFVAVVVCTQGVPTDEMGNKGRDVIKDFFQSLRSLSDLPVKITFRLCTDNEQVVDFYNTLDAHEKMDCDVLDDFWGEAMEVYLHNPWLTYGIGIHRLREAGVATELMDCLDETAFTLEEIHEFCLDFFGGKNLDAQLTSPNHDFHAFIADLGRILEREKLVWNPLTNKLCAWIDINQLHALNRKAAKTGRGRTRSSYCRGVPLDPEGVDPTQIRTSNPQSGFPDKTKFKRSHISRGGSFRKASPRPKPAFTRSATAPPDYNGPSTAPHSTLGANQFSQSASSVPSEPKDLVEAIKYWSRAPPLFKKMNPLGKLLVDIPTLFPASNDFVEDHDYFDTWKEFSDDAFSEESGDELKELLRRAARKAKFFLHPDKLPKDLTENQTFLFKSIWNIIQESEGVTL